MKKLLKISILLSLLISAGVASASVINTTRPDFINRGLVLLQTLNGKDILNGKFMDLSPQGNNCTATSIASSTFYTMGKIGQAGNFDGVNDYLNCGTPASLAFTKDTPFTQAAWVKGTIKNTNNCVMGNFHSTLGIGYFLCIIDPVGRVYAQLSTSGSIYSYRIGTTPIEDGKWHYIVATYDGSSAAAGFKLYVDGVEEAYTDTTNSGTLGSIASSASFSIGSRGNLGAQQLFFPGQIDEARVYNRVLNILEIKELYRNRVLEQASKRMSVKGLLPLDQVQGAALAYSLRQLKSTYNGPLIRVRRESDAVESDIGIGINTPSGKGLDTAALASFCSAVNCFVKTWYDQSGYNRDATQSTILAQPQIVFSGTILVSSSTAARPVIYFDFGNDNFLFSTTSVANGVTFSGVLKSNDTSTAGNTFISGATGAAEWSFNTFSHKSQMVMLGTNTATANTAHTNNWQILSANSSAAGATQSFRLNGVADGTASLSQPFSEGVSNFCFSTGNTKKCHAYIGEMIVYDSALSDAKTQTLQTNQNNYYKIY